jgi:hypothetical protein
MDYLKQYNTLIEFRKENVPNGYTENHHVIPKSLGGDNSKENKVLLTGREHYVAHLLLAKIHKGTKNYKPMIYAVWVMQMNCEERGINRIKSSRMYEWVRKEFSKYISKRNSKMKGKMNSQYGTMWISNLELKENKKIHREEEIPEGWVKGRNTWSIVGHKKVFNKTCPHCNRCFNGKKTQVYCCRSCSARSCQVGKTMSDEAKEKLSKYWSNKPRPYRRGMKHKKHGM